MYRHLKAVKLKEVFQVYGEMQKKTRSKDGGQSVAQPCDMVGKETRTNQQDLRRHSQTSRRETEGRYPGSQGKKSSRTWNFVNRPIRSGPGI